MGSLFVISAVIYLAFVLYYLLSGTDLYCLLFGHKWMTAYICKDWPSRCKNKRRLYYQTCKCIRCGKYKY